FQYIVAPLLSPSAPYVNPEYNSSASRHSLPSPPTRCYAIPFWSPTVRRESLNAARPRRLWALILSAARPTTPSRFPARAAPPVGVPHMAVSSRFLLDCLTFRVFPEFSLTFS